MPELDDENGNKEGNDGYLPRMMSQASVLAAVSGPSDASALEAIARDEELAQAKALAEAEAALEKASQAESAAAAAEAAAEQQLAAMKVENQLGWVRVGWEASGVRFKASKIASIRGTSTHVQVNAYPTRLCNRMKECAHLSINHLAFVQYSSFSTCPSSTFNSGGRGSSCSQSSRGSRRCQSCL